RHGKMRGVQRLRSVVRSYSGARLNGVIPGTQHLGVMSTTPQELLQSRKQSTLAGTQQLQKTTCSLAANTVTAAAPDVAASAAAAATSVRSATVRTITTSTSNKQNNPELVHETSGEELVYEASAGTKKLQVRFGDGHLSEYPYAWIRENCQCPQCFNSEAIARTFLVEDLDVNLKPREIKVTEDTNITVTWEDGHISPLTGSWLRCRSFTSEARKRNRARYKLKRIPWREDFKLPELDFDEVMNSEHAILDWIVKLERYGVLLLKNSPAQVGPILDLMDKLGFVKKTHYGTDYEIITSHFTNNLAYTGSKLALHTDLPYLDYFPGTTWLHCIKQHEGLGGDNDLCDGIMAAEILREKHPEHFKTLTTSYIYFQDKGRETYEFDQMNKTTTIVLDDLGEVSRLHCSSQSRDSIMDLDSDQVIEFYEALKTFSHILIDVSIRKKTEPGDIIVIDNSRVFHGRQAFDPLTAKGQRHIHNAYIDWDWLRSKRRVLQDKLKIHFE
ncbi:unnamed protein product, partial [Meganyctiphanes norvegica]